MADDHRVICADRSKNTGCHIVGIGIADGSYWTKWQAITAIGNKTDIFYTVDRAGNEAEVEATRCETCNKWTLHTRRDEETDNNLDALRQCEKKP